MSIIKASSKGQIVLPRELRQRHGIQRGTLIEVVDFGRGVIALVPIQDDPCAVLSGMFKSTKPVRAILQGSRVEDKAHEQHLASSRRKS